MNDHDEVDFDESERLILGRVQVGMQCEQFLATDVGRYLKQRCLEEAQDAMLALVEASPLDAETIRSLQNRIYRARSIPQWLDEAVFQGNQAADALRRLDEER